MVWRWAAVVLAGLTLAAWAGEPAIVFKDFTASAGLAKPLEDAVGYNAAWGDLDGDRYPDLYVGCFSDVPPQKDGPPKPVPSKLFTNHDGQFTEVPEQRLYARTSAATFIDLDRDGDDDLWVSTVALAKPLSEITMEPQKSAQVQRSMFYRNDGGRLVEAPEVTAQHIVSAREAVPMDHDLDGHLDLLLLEDRSTPNPDSVVWRNRGNLDFAPSDLGLPGNLYGFGAAVADLNDDGRPDFYVSDCNVLFLSYGVRYDQAQGEAFLGAPSPHEDGSSGPAFGDLNRDGLLDMVLGMDRAPARPRVFLNEGTALEPRFRDATAELGFPEEIPMKVPHTEIQDFDNDGWPDVYFSAGSRTESGEVTPLIFRSRRAKRFEPLFPPAQANATYRGPSADYSGDGRLDLIMVNADDVRLLLNRGAGTNSWLQVKAPIGAQIRLFDENGKLLGYQQVFPNGGRDRVFHFGLGNATSITMEARLQGSTIRRSVARNRRIQVP